MTVRESSPNRANKQPSLGTALAAPKFGFGRSARLLLPEDFKQALTTRPVARTDYFICHFTPARDGAMPAPLRAKLGFVVPRRLARLAVRRNTIKRILRECFRTKQDSLPAGHIVIRLKAPIKAASLTELKTIVRDHTEKLFLQLSRIPT